MGVASLQLLTQFIPRVSDATELSDDQKEDMGSKIFSIINGLVWVPTEMIKKNEKKNNNHELKAQSVKFDKIPKIMVDKICFKIF